MIRSPKEYALALLQAGETVDSLSQVIQMYGTHKDTKCDEDVGKCVCGLMTFLVIGESKLQKFRTQLESLLVEERHEV